VTPDASFAFLGDDDIRFQYTVDNRDQAPEGTSFTAGGASQNTDVATDIFVIDNAGMSHGAEAVGVGDSEIQGSLYYQVPGGPEMTLNNGAQSTVGVLAYSGTFTTRKEAVNSTGGADNELDIGDRYIVECEFSDIDEAAMDTVMYLGVNMAQLTLQSEETEGLTWRGTYVAASVGDVEGSLSLTAGNFTDRTPLISHEISLNIQFSRQEFLNRQGMADRLVLNQYLGLEGATETLCRNYSTAWKNHTDALSEASKNERLVGELILTAALTFATGGVGGVVGNYMKNTLQAGAFVSDAVKDLAKLGFKSGMSAALPGGGGGAPFAAFPEDPASWGSRAKQRVSDECKGVHDCVVDWDAQILSNNSNFRRDFDPHEEISQALRIAGQNLSSAAGSLTTSADDFEKGFWTNWLEHYGYTAEFSGMAGMYMPDENWDNSAIRDRLEALGIDATPYVERARERAAAESTRLNERYGFPSPFHGPKI